MTCKLVVIGGRYTTREQVPGVLNYHRQLGRCWFRRHPRPLPAGTRVAAKVAGVSEVWMLGIVRTGEPYRDPDGPEPDRWPWAMDIDWDPPAERGIPVAELFGSTGVHAREGLVGVPREEVAEAVRRLYAA